MFTDIKKANKTVYVLAALLAISIFLVIMLADIFGGRRFNDPVKDSEAKSHIDKYRGAWTFNTKSKIIWYDIDSIRRYINPKGTFDELTSNMTGSPDCRWAVGFYPMKRDDANGKTRLDFLIVPTLVSNKDGSVIDFNDSKNAALYASKTGAAINPACADCTGYDAGHIWP
jgi:hypothetical protein